MFAFHVIQINCWHAKRNICVYFRDSRRRREKSMIYNWLQPNKIFLHECCILKQQDLSSNASLIWYFMWIMVQIAFYYFPLSHSCFKIKRRKFIDPKWSFKIPFRSLIRRKIISKGSRSTSHLLLPFNIFLKEKKCASFSSMHEQ